MYSDSWPQDAETKTSDFLVFEPSPKRLGFVLERVGWVRLSTRNMTIEQMQTIGAHAAATCDASLCPPLKLENGVWTVGFKQHKEIMALQIPFPDREVAEDYDLFKAEEDLERIMRGAIMMS